MVCGVIQIPAEADGETGQTEHGALFFQKAQPRRDCKQGGVRLGLVTSREALETVLVWPFRGRGVGDFWVIIYL